MKSTDRWLVAADNALRTLAGASQAARANPAALTAEAELAEPDRRLAGALMRVNHVGEVCAQALYQAQALTARSEPLRRQMAASARDEIDHLAWTQQRLAELHDRPSLLNPLWYAGAFGLGLLAGRLGDRASLGFVVETERQVEQHLAGGLQGVAELGPARSVHHAGGGVGLDLGSGARAVGCSHDEAFPIVNPPETAFAGYARA